jgi:hypothetical protein
MQRQAKVPRGQASAHRTTRDAKVVTPSKRAKSKKSRNVLSWADLYQYTVPQWNGCRGQGAELPEAY